MSKRLSLAVLLVVVAMLAVACGGGGDNNTSSSTSSTSSSSGNVQRVEISLTDFRFNPNEITVNRGQQVEIVLKNDGRVAHDFQIEALGVKSAEIAPGQSTTVTFTPNNAGSFQIICSVPGHSASGMTGTLVVR